jgi:hypothetical protein
VHRNGHSSAWVINFVDDWLPFKVIGHSRTGRIGPEEE